MPDDNDILDLPPTPDEQAGINDAISILTDYLIRLQNNEIVSIAIIAERFDGTYGVSWTPARDRMALGARLIRLGLERIGFTQLSDVQSEINSALGENGIDI